MSLQNPKDVNITDNTISVLLAGGLGNMMFQAATLMVYAKEMGYDPLIGYWTTHQSESSKPNPHLNREGRNIHFDPWGGHILKDPHISFGDVYPKLPWFDSRPNAFQWWFDQSLAWDIDTGEGGVYYDLKQKVKPPYLFQGYFFNKLYWHHQRDYILELFTGCRTSVTVMEVTAPAGLIQQSGRCQSMSWTGGMILTLTRI